MIELIKELDSKYNCKVKYICCDNTGEHISFEKSCKEQGLGVFFEYTTPGTGQQNGRVEQKFAKLCKWVWAVLNGGKITSSLRNQLWAYQLKLQQCYRIWCLNREYWVHITNSLGREEQVFWIQFNNLVKSVLLLTVLLIKQDEESRKALHVDGICWQSCFQMLQVIESETKQIVIMKKSYGDWANVKDQAIVP